MKCALKRGEKSHRVKRILQGGNHAAHYPNLPTWVGTFDSPSTVLTGPGKALLP